MKDIGAIAPAEAHPPVEPHDRLDKDNRQPRRPRKPPSDDDMVETQPHKLDLEA